MPVQKGRGQREPHRPSENGQLFFPWARRKGFRARTPRRPRSPFPEGSDGSGRAAASSQEDDHHRRFCSFARSPLTREPNSPIYWTHRHPLPEVLLTHLSSAPSFRRANPAARHGWAPRCAVQVVVDWSTAGEEPSPALSARVELEADESSVGAETRWTCRELGKRGWEEALSAAACDEVVLTAELDDPRAKHLVLGLAEHLTQKLAATHPLIRVRFLPRSRGASRNRHSSTRQ